MDDQQVLAYLQIWVHRNSQSSTPQPLRALVDTNLALPGNLPYTGPEIPHEDIKVFLKKHVFCDQFSPISIDHQRDTEIRSVNDYLFKQKRFHYLLIQDFADVHDGPVKDTEKVKITSILALDTIVQCCPHYVCYHVADWLNSVRRINHDPADYIVDWVASHALSDSPSSFRNIQDYTKGYGTRTSSVGLKEFIQRHLTVRGTVRSTALAPTISGLEQQLKHALPWMCWIAHEVLWKILERSEPPCGKVAELLDLYSTIDALFGQSCDRHTVMRWMNLMVLIKPKRTHEPHPINENIHEKHEDGTVSKLAEVLHNDGRPLAVRHFGTLAERHPGDLASILSVYEQLLLKGGRAKVSLEKPLQDWPMLDKLIRALCERKPSITHLDLISMCDLERFFYVEAVELEAFKLAQMHVHSAQLPATTDRMVLTAKLILMLRKIHTPIHPPPQPATPGPRREKLDAMQQRGRDRRSSTQLRRARDQEGLRRARTS